MATDLFFSKPMTPNPASGTYSDKTGAHDSAHLTKTRTNRESKKGEGESFLTTLKKVSRNPYAAKKLPNTNMAKRNETRAAAIEDDMNETSDPKAAGNEDVSACTASREVRQAEEPDQMPAIQNFIYFVRALEEMGFHHSDGGFGRHSRTDAELSDGKDLVALNSLMIRLQQKGLVSSAELKAAFDRLQQFITGVLDGKTQTRVDGTSGNGQSVGLVQDSARIFQLLKELFADLYQQDMDTKMAEGQGSADTKPSVSTSSGAKGTGEPAANVIDLTGIFKSGNPIQSTENAGLTSHAASSGTEDSEKGAPEKPLSSAQINENPKEMAAIEKTDADTSRPKEESAFWRETKTVGRVDSAHQGPAAEEPMLPKDPHTIQNNRPAKQSVPAGLKVESGSPSNGVSQAATGEESAARALQEIQSPKDGSIKVSSGMNEETVAKVIKSEAGSHDSGLLNSQNHPMEKIAETQSFIKEVQSDRSSLNTQTLDQIVNKAAIHLKNGQHEARIDLKPDYLGHIRMQVISEDHQVTVKILTEHGFVKDMIENNAHQLKADLQQQGLHIDKLEVSVSRDSDESGNPRERFAGMRTRQDASDNGKQENHRQDPPRHRPPRRTPGGAATVDYFA